MLNVGHERSIVVLGTRGSKLAVQQSEWVQGQLHALAPHVTVTLRRIQTSGDKILDVPLAQIGGKGLFVKEIEEALLSGEIDLAVHSMKDVPTEFIPWGAESEVQDLHHFDIGLYPIPANEWSLGKSSLKALTYMAIAIPFVATAYGTNYRIMQQGEQGFTALSEEEWIECIIKLIDDVELRKKMGIAGRKTVEDFYSVKANFSKYLQVFNAVVKG